MDLFFNEEKELTTLHHSYYFILIITTMKFTRVYTLCALLAFAFNATAQSDAELDIYRKNFENILYYTPSEAQKIEKIKAEVPAAFFQKKGFYALTKAMEMRSIPFIEFMLSQPGVSITGTADYTRENILAYLPWDQYKMVKPGTCAQTDTLLELRKKFTSYLVSKGVSLSHIDANGNHLMMRTVMNKDLEFLQFLYDLNGKQLVNPEQENLLYYASYVGCIDITKWLVEHGHDVNMVNKYEGSAIGAAVRHPEIVRYLLSKGANPNLTKPGGWTPLMYAANYGNVESLQLLLDAGADVKAVNSRGWDALQVAKEYKQKEAQKVLKKAMDK